MIDDLTILVPTRNRPNDLSRCLKSIHDNFGAGQKVIVGDNGDAQITRSILESLDSLSVTHIANPAGGTYISNIQTLIDQCGTTWLSILHDDDFFVANPPSLLSKLADPSVDFIFSDHWIASHEGVIDPVRSDSNTRRYGRSDLKPGLQVNLGALAANCLIPLDGFFVRTSLAKSIRLDSSSPCYSDLKWLIEVAEHSRSGVYLGERLFAYQTSVESLTSNTIPLAAHLDQWRSMRKTNAVHPETKRAVRRRTMTCGLRVVRAFIRHWIRGPVRPQQ